MKKVVAFLLIFAHLFSTVGWSMQIHDCLGSQSYAVFGIKLGSPCECNHHKKENGKKCCSEKKILIKAEKKESLASNHHSPLSHSSTAIALPSTSLFLPYLSADPAGITSRLHHDHPPGQTLPLFLLYRNLLI